MPKTIVSYKAKILQVNKSLEATLTVYRDALTFVIEIVNCEWCSLSSLMPKEQYNTVEKLIHTTKQNKAKYDFDAKFYKFPSYLRRNIVATAIGKVSSYRSNVDNYLLSGNKKHNPPSLNLKHYEFPALYKGNMFVQVRENEFKIKAYKNNDWVWVHVRLRQQDINYFKKKNLVSYYSPVLEKRGRSFYLRFPFGYKKTKLSGVPASRQTVLAVDLGYNHSAVCSIMRSNGTVTGRKFINQPVEKDQMGHLLNRLKVKQAQGGRYAENSKLWARINNLNRAISEQTANDIVDYAVQNKVDVIVFEYLNLKGKVYGSKKQKLHLWKKRFVYQLCLRKAHFAGIRVSPVNPANTSKLAFDGTGKVKRDEKNYSLCTFQSGKQYSTDLNASYNIGARYFIRELKKAVSEKKWSDCLAKVPDLQQRTQCTLSTLISFHVALAV